ncbi:MAG: hypothetical protein WCD79_05215 [Chthoniobacteraceae bacterium]
MAGWPYPGGRLDGRVCTSAAIHFSSYGWEAEDRPRAETRLSAQVCITGPDGQPIKNVVVTAISSHRGELLDLAMSPVHTNATGEPPSEM